MKKILYGVMSLVMTGAIVTASAYALFSDTAVVSGIDINTSDADIQVGLDGATYVQSLDLTGILSIEDIYPGFGVDNSESDPFWIMNASSNVDMDLSAQLTAATGWDDSDLKNHVEVAMVLPSTDPGDAEYYTLAEWNAAPIALPGGPLAPGQEVELEIFIRMPETAPDTLENVSLTDIAFTITGTQVAP